MFSILRFGFYFVFGLDFGFLVDKSAVSILHNRKKVGLKLTVHVRLPPSMPAFSPWPLHRKPSLVPRP